MNYYERHIGDYLKDTAHLSLLEHGVYGRMLDVYYTREAAIPAGQVERLIGVRSKEEREALRNAIAAGRSGEAPAKPVVLTAPATAENVLRALGRLS